MHMYIVTISALGVEHPNVSNENAERGGVTAKPTTARDRLEGQAPFGAGA